MTPTAPVEVAVLGASAGSLEALTSLLSALPEGFGLPLLVVVHLPAGRESLLAPLLQARCRLSVREAEDKQPIEPGTVFIAPPDYHLLLGRDRALALSVEEPVQYSRPSIDVLFETAADAMGAGVLGVILTGANSDGARGLRAICDAGGLALVQDPDQATSPEMPRAALALCPEARALRLDEIAEFLVQLPRSSRIPSP